MMRQECNGLTRGAYVEAAGESRARKAWEIDNKNKSHNVNKMTNLKNLARNFEGAVAHMPPEAWRFVAKSSRKRWSIE
ncbi:hypothetical protein E2C01_010914 [Portunus trituberculatus]|uniref:Uncharacterized protein n=1 Tax=Portunus trituberculatus TaxID=210409 RepID=A0A5B7DA02_PORTR|nr:hypothetical protein [Portunus trituberculatus]